MNEVNPKGGKLVLATPYLSEEQMNIEIDKIMSSFPHLSREQVRADFDEELKAETYVNNIYQVTVKRGSAVDFLIRPEFLKGKCTWLSIKRRDKRPVNHWQDMQTMKNRLVGTECDAFQIFPAESRMVNTSNQYHLIVLPEGYQFPFGWFEGRTVITENIEDCAGANQSFRGDL